MLNTIFSRFATRKNSHKEVSISQMVLPEPPKDRSLYYKYLTYFCGQGYSSEEAQLIADLYQSSADNADDVSVDVPSLQKDYNLSLHLNAVEVGLYGSPKGTRQNQLLCRLSLEAALELARKFEVFWERGSRHFLEYYWLA